MTLSIKVEFPSGKHVMTLSDGSIGYTSPLATRLFLKIERGQKIAIIGANGIGKSTLLKTVAGNLPLLKGEMTLGTNVIIGYYAQDQVQALDDRKTVLENIMSQGDVSEQRARATLGGVLFQKDDVFKKTGVLSGGEKSRLGLSCLLVQKSNFLLLDEPTNHLDMSSTEVLSDALEDFKGTVLFVSHNRSFINHVATHIFAMTSDGRGELFEGKLDDYERLAERAHFPNVLKLG